MKPLFPLKLLGWVQGRGVAMAPRIYLVFPDLGGAKAEALCRLAGQGRKVDVLLSYSVLLAKPATGDRLASLRRQGCLGSVMLDSGAYHVAYHGLRLEPEEYALGVSGLGGVVDLVVGPDVPRRPSESVERLRRFSASYGGSFIPVLQSKTTSPRGYLATLEALEYWGLLERAPRVDGGRPLVGIGGLVGARVGEVSLVVDALERACDCAFHLFGANVRMVRGLARRGLLSTIHSLDTSGWLWEIRWRRRTVYKATTTLEANIAAIVGYLEKMRQAASTRG